MKKRKSISTFLNYYVVLSILFIFKSNAIAQKPTLALHASFSTSSHFIQQQDDSYQHREDEYDPRHEGIKLSKKQNVTSDKIELLSAKMLFDMQEEYSDYTVFHMGFYSPEQVSPEVHIAYDPKLYYVDPDREKWGPGISIFKWPANIIVRNEIPINELHSRAILIKNGNRILFPTCIYANELPDTIQHYQFSIVPLMKMKIRCLILDVDTETIIHSNDFGDVSANQIRSFIWQCIDENGSPFADGEYALQLRGSYRNSVGHKKSVNVTYSFIHQSRLRK
jgi:hypothetical protein